MPDNRIFVVLNDRSGAAAEAKLDAAALSARLSRAGYDVEIDADTHLSLAERVKGAAASNAGIVLAAGGDGTVTAVASALAGTDKALAILPLGTANLLARDLKIPLDMAEAIDALATMAPRRIDAGEVNGRLFLHKAVIGLAPALAEERERMRTNENFSARLRFFVSFLRRLRQPHALDLSLDLDGQDEPRRLRVRSIAVANNAYDEGLGRFFARSRLDRGLLTVYTLRRLSIGDFLRLVFGMAIGRWRRDEALDIHEAHRVTLRTRAKRLKTMIDGEVALMAPPLEFRTLPGAIRVMAPAAEAARGPEAGETLVASPLAEPLAGAA
ncbi:diacylglycerol kinase [Afifella sp. IM 167]|nr:diacylglycerol kinase [Afifella sp. IM 167]